MGAPKVSRHFKTFLFGCQLHLNTGSDSDHDYSLKFFFAN